MSEKNPAVVIIQARMGSSRLPGKVMKNLHGRTVLSHVIERVKNATGVDAVIVATSTKPSDDVIVSEAQSAGARAFRGSELDVLDRYYQAAKEAGAETVVRVTSDCPLYDPQVLSRMLAVWNERGRTGKRPDYFSNSQKRTFPRGLDTEIFSFQALERAQREATFPEEREHVTLYLYRHPEKFAIDQFVQNTDWSQLRWTLDTDDDWNFVAAVYGKLYRPGALFSTDEVLKLLERHPEISALNAHVRQKDVIQR